MKKRSSPPPRVVFSTEHGRMCPECGNPVKRCRCQKSSQGNVGDGIVRISRETKGRRGKCVTVITNIPLAADELSALGKQLKKKCGTGGTVKNGVVEIQGDHREKLLAELQGKGWTVKIAGG